MQVSNCLWTAPWGQNQGVTEGSPRGHRTEGHTLPPHSPRYNSHTHNTHSPTHTPHTQLTHSQHTLPHTHFMHPTHTHTHTNTYNIHSLTNTSHMQHTHSQHTLPRTLMHPSVHALTMHPCTDSLCFTHSFTALSADSFKNRLTSPPVFSFPGSLIYVTVHPPVQLIQLPGIRSCAGDLDLGNSELQHSEREVRCGERGLLRTLHPSPGLMLRDRELLSAVSDGPREAWLRTPRCTSNTKAPACVLMEA